MKATGGSFKVGQVGRRVVVPVGKIGRAVAWLLPNHWERVLPSRWKGELYLHGWETEAIPYDASPEQLADAISKASGAGVRVEATDNDGHTITFTGELLKEWDQ